jgi:predicted RNA binding protein YcfA (HicA-like mRNA interferase family)
MKIPRDLSGRELIQCLCCNWGYRVIHQEGSHVLLETEEPSHQRLSIPDHKILRVGTLNAILRAVANHKHIERQVIIESL